MAHDFTRHGPDDKLIFKCQTLDTTIVECFLSASGAVAKKKTRYQRSWRLSEPGLILHFWKVVLSTKDRKAKFNKKTVTQAKKYDLIKVATLTKCEVCTKVCSSRADLWQAQNDATQNQIEWLKKYAQNRARAKNQIDWEKNMKAWRSLQRSTGSTNRWQM